MDSKGIKGASGYNIDSTNFKQDIRYKISFDITLNEGKLNYLGGHFHIANASKVTVNNQGVLNNFGINYANDAWRFGFEFPEKFAVEETKHIEITFIADRYDNPTHENKKFAIHPNRIYGAGHDWNTQSDTSVVTIDNLVLTTYN